MSDTTSQQERIFHGTPVSKGVVRGQVRLIDGSFEAPPDRRIPASKVGEELSRYQEALSRTREELESLIGRLDDGADQHTKEILEMHIMVLEDSYVSSQVETFVKEGHEGAESAYFRVVKNCMESFQRIPDAYMRERALDIKDVAQRVMRHLRGTEIQQDDAPANAIYIAHDLTPSETAQMDRSRVLGFAVELGSKTSHTAIVARSLGLPAVVRLHGILEELRNGDEILLDGDEGVLIVNPSPATLAKYQAREAAEEQREAQFQSGCDSPAITKCGRRVVVAANAEFVEELSHMRSCGAEGLGLFRTEFFYLEKPEATEQELTDHYTKVVQAAAPELVIFRTLDVGGDKLDATYAYEVEQNPFLGWRGIRVSLAKPELFKRQLRAILRSGGADGQIGIMYPMVTSVSEVISANQLLAECRIELESMRVPIPKKIQVGAMIEVPSAAATADLLAQHVDFFSIGTNDLTQYTLAVDRVNERVSEMYQPTHPAVLRLIRNVVRDAHEKGIWVGICGEMAGDISLIPLLVGLELDELSAASGQVAKVKHAIRQLDAAACRALVEKVLQEHSAVAIQELSLEFSRRHFAEALQ